MPGTPLRVLHIVANVLTLEVGVTIFFLAILQLRKLRRMHVNELAKSHDEEVKLSRFEFWLHV